MFDWNDLKSFLAVAESGSTLSAAQALRVSQTQLLQPFLAMLFAWPLLGERPDLLSIAFAYGLERRLGKLRRAVEVMIELPYALPGVVLAIAVLQILQSGLNTFPQISNFYLPLIWGATLLIVISTANISGGWLGRFRKKKEQS